MARVYQSNHPLIQHKLALLRDKNTAPPQFRHLIRELGYLLTYEATQDLVLKPIAIETPVAPMEAQVLAEQIGLVPILRAGMGMVEGVLDLIPNAQVWHIGLYRDERTLHPIEYYNKLPAQATVQLCLVLDPMLATGGSAVATINLLKRWGAKHIKFIGLIAAPEGIRHLSESHPDVPIHIAAVDSYLNERGYIVPGLGDAGDRQYDTI